MEVLTIDDEEHLYRRITEEHFDTAKGKVNSSAFCGRELSVDWAKFTTPTESIARPPIGTCLVQVQAKYPRQVEQEVLHSPSPTNYSHALIVGDKKQSVRRFIRNHSTIILGP